jgi:hypothetical protein
LEKAPGPRCYYQHAENYGRSGSSRSTAISTGRALNPTLLRAKPDGESEIALFPDLARRGTVLRRRENRMLRSRLVSLGSGPGGCRHLRPAARELAVRAAAPHAFTADSLPLDGDWNRVGPKPGRPPPAGLRYRVPGSIRSGPRRQSTPRRRIAAGVVVLSPLPLPARFAGKRLRLQDATDYY